MKQISSLLLSCLLLLPAGMNAEEDAPKQWTLRDCIDYALEHNITIQRNRISAESAQEDVKTAKADFLPSLSGNIASASSTARTVQEAPSSAAITSRQAKAKPRTTVATASTPTGLCITAANG